MLLSLVLIKDNDNLKFLFEETNTETCAVILSTLNAALKALILFYHCYGI